MRRPRLHQPWLLPAGVVTVAIWVVELAAGRDVSDCILWIAIGLMWSVGAFRAPPAHSVEGPGPLRATPARRFRATGWPPSKRPDDYR